jgi:hypothetical protein
LWSGASDGSGEIEGFDFLRPNYDWEKRSLGTIGSAKRGGHGQDLAYLIISKLQFCAPAGLGGPIGDELLLVDWIGWRWRWMLVRCGWPRTSLGKCGAWEAEKQ